MFYYVFDNILLFRRNLEENSSLLVWCNLISVIYSIHNCGWNVLGSQS